MFFDVASFGGGGHKKAAGATLRMTLAEAEAALERSVQAALDRAEVERP